MRALVSSDNRTVADSWRIYLEPPWSVAELQVVSAFGNALGDVRQRFFDLIDQDQAQVAGLEVGQRGIDGEEFAVDFLDVAGPAGVRQSLRSRASTSPSARPRWQAS